MDRPSVGILVGNIEPFVNVLSTASFCHVKSSELDGT
jgi:hypothetical protein